eukprot:m.74883 g.74883  ORF g.74883 m.74883 type:complete len:554 (+) comp10352_c0_seq1:71-1732(+)
MADGAQERRGLLLVTANAYLLPELLVNADNASCTHQRARSRDLGRLLSALSADIVLGQEVWGSQTAQLEAGLGPEYYIPWRFRTLLPGGGAVAAGRIGTVADTLKFRACSTGGLYFACRTDIPVVLERSHTFAKSGTRSGKGCFAAVLDLRTRLSVAPPTTMGEGRAPDVCSAGAGGEAVGGTAGALPPFLLVVNVHLDPGHSPELQAFQRHQVSEVARFLSETVAAATAFIAAELSGGAGPTGGRALGVLCCGDWNCNPAHSAVYRDIVAGLGAKVIDVATTLPGPPDSTYDDQNELCAWSSGRERLDLVFNVQQLHRDGQARTEDGGALGTDDQGGRGVPLAEVPICSAVALTQPAGREISDHWPLAVGLGRLVARFTRDALRSAAEAWDTFTLESCAPTDRARLFLGSSESGELVATETPERWRVGGPRGGGECAGWLQHVTSGRWVIADGRPPGGDPPKGSTLRLGEADRASPLRIQLPGGGGAGATGTLTVVSPPTRMGGSSVLDLDLGGGSASENGCARQGMRVTVWPARGLLQSPPNQLWRLGGPD